MQLTNSEWKREAEIAAAHEHGRNHAGWYVFRRYGATPLGALAIAVVVAFGARWLWHHVHLPSAGPGPVGLPVLFWVLLVALALGTVVSFRPTRTFRPASVILVRAVVTGLLWLGFATYAITVVV